MLLARRRVFQGGGNTANPAEPFCAVAGQFRWGDLGLAGGTDGDPDHLAAPIDVGAEGLANFGANRGEALGEVGGGEAVLGESLLIESP
jgi:hypothetical protein